MKRKITISALPSDAVVSVYQNGEYKVLGKTPLTLDESTLEKALKDHQEFLALKISKSGFIPETLYLDLQNRYAVNYNAKLNAVDIWNNKEAEISSVAANKLAIKVQRINQQVFKKNLDSALRSTELLIDQFPKAHVFYDMKGSILFLMGKKSEAMASYQKSLSLNPDNSEAKNMIEKGQGSQQ